jgi:hypothetical protein
MRWLSKCMVPDGSYLVGFRFSRIKQEDLPAFYELAKTSGLQVYDDRSLSRMEKLKKGILKLFSRNYDGPAPESRAEVIAELKDKTENYAKSPGLTILTEFRNAACKFSYDSTVLPVVSGLA